MAETSPVFPPADPNPTPVPAPKSLDFPKAMAEVIAGKKIYRLEWKDKEFYGVLSDGRLKIHKPDGSLNDWVITDGDLLGTDWVVI